MLNPGYALLNLQHQYCDEFHLKQRAQLVVAQQQLNDSSDPATHRTGRSNIIRLQSVSNIGSLAFVNALPSMHSLTMSNDLFAISLRRVLGLPLLLLLSMLSAATRSVVNVLMMSICRHVPTSIRSVTIVCVTHL